LSESADQPFKSFAAGLTEPEVFAVHFCSEVTRVFVDMQIDLFSVSGQSPVSITHLVLPSDGDLSSVPGVVDAIPSSDFEEWWKLMTGTDEPPFLDACGLFEIFCETASFKQRSELIPSPSGQGLERIAATMHTQTDEITRLRDAVDSNSAAQMPIIDTLQQLVRKMDGPSRYRAEESLKKEIGEHIYTSLCRPAFEAAIAAEYVWLDVNFPDPSMIVAHLATAFERQLRDAVFKRFCDALVASGAWNYPEREGNPVQAPVPPTARAPVPPASASRPSPSQPVPSIRPDHSKDEKPVLLNQRHMNDRLTLGDMKLLLAKPNRAMLRIFGEWGIDVLQLARLCKQIADNRNKAVHQGGFTREQACNLRESWLGPQYPGSSVFAALIPKAYQDRS
jgi:hypothetical protein